ncbi:5-(carboxyamino)imidazole ribonucleotide synthase [Hydrogenivirga sp.]
MNVGILGGGQLGWMTILEGRKLGFRFFVLDKNPEAPASRVADVWFPPDRVDEFYRTSDVITYEFEHIEEDILLRVEDKVLPSLEAVRLKINRGEEKSFLYRHGYPIAPFRRGKLSELEGMVREIGTPAVVKSERLGYDGKGQYKVNRLEDLREVYRNHSQEEIFVVEEFVDFVREVSAVGVRDSQGHVKVFPITENVHEEGILLFNRTLDRTPCEREVVGMVAQLLEELKIVGLLAVEFFITKDGRVLINEFAPRPHNTGHYTLDGSYTSQFENLLRALTGLPLGSTKLKLPTGMVNILGIAKEDLPIGEVLQVEGAKLYWYGKERKPRRKMGHVNVVSKDESRLMEKLRDLLRIIYQKEHSLS